MKCGRPKCQRSAYRQGVCHAHYRLVPSGYVDAAPVLERYRVLRERGLTTHQIARLSGVNRDTLRRMGRWGEGRVRRGTADLLMAVNIPPMQSTGVHVSSVGTCRRIQSLAAAGYSLGFIGKELGVTQQAVTAVLKQDMVIAETAVKVAELFDRLHMTPGPSTRARKWAQRRGWVLPLCWDEDTIDNPDAVPDAGAHRPVSASQRIAELRELGVTDLQEIAERLGIKRDSVERQLIRGRAA